MKLHLDKKLFQDSIQATAQHIGIPEVYVEKDYWVSLVLLEIFSSDISDLLEKHNMASFHVQALSVERTLCEKIMSLVRFSQVEDRDVILSSKVRHIYDLHLMLKNEKILSFFNEDDFIKMIVKVGEDDFIGYKNNNEWLKNHPGSAVIFDSPEKVWQHIMDVYQGSFKQMVYGELPSESDLLDTLGKIGTRIKPIDWQVGR